MADSNYGIKTSGDDLNWRNLNNDHEDNPVVTALVKDADKIFSEDNVNDNVIILSNELIEDFNKYLLENKLGSFFDNSSTNDNKNSDTKNNKNKKKKEKKPVIKKSDLMKQNLEKEKNKKEIQKFLTNLKLDNNYYPFKKTKLHESFLNIVYWACYLIKNYKKDNISIEILCDASISLFRAINDCDKIINNDIKAICIQILEKLEKCLSKRNSNYVYELLSKYYYLITTSLWDKDKPNNIVLYDEQKQAITKIYDSIVEDKPLFLFYWVPPANGKTLVSVIIAKTISNYYRGLHKNKLRFFQGTIFNAHDPVNGPFQIEYDDGEIQNDITINMIRPLNSHKLKNKVNEPYEIGTKIEAQKFVEPKILLYICYNDIVRNTVSSLCVTHNVDIKFWIATYRQDKYKPDVYLVDFRPYKNCYPDWRKNKSAKLFKHDEKNADRRYDEDIRTQMLQYLDETRMIQDREKEVEHHINFIEENTVERCKNLPEMIISDLDSAYELLNEFPNMFIPYFDEAFAASNQMITSKIMSVLPKTSILVSATLATYDKIPTILNNFKERHSATDEHIETIRTSRQHINCEFISPEGDLISPFHNIESCDEIDSFIDLMNKNPIIERGFSNLIVLKMFEKLKDDLPENDNLLFVEYLGNITNSNIREYGKKLLKFCSNNERYFDKIKKISIPKIQDNTIDNIFTKNAHIYNNKNTLHVSNPDHFGIYVQNITSEFLKDSPNLKKLISEYKKSKENIENEIKHIEKNVKDDNDGTKSFKIQEANSKLAEIKFKYPSEFLMNSQNHFKKFNSKIRTISDPKTILFNDTIVNNFSDFMAKLYLSGIGVYNQSDLDSYELEVFLKYKDMFRFIISDPSIIYGTNINLTMIDIHENLASISTRNTIYQLMGRGGRFGKSSSAVVNFRSWDLFNIVVDNNDINIEATNIENNLIEILNT